MIDSIKARLEAQPSPWPFGVYDGEPPAGVETPYICIYDQTGRTDRGTKAHGGVVRVYAPFQLSCVARTREGLRDLLKVARSVCGWAPVANASPIVEDGSNPILPTGEGTDQRLLAPLTMHCYLP